jgi:hypothetical protein
MTTATTSSSTGHLSPTRRKKLLHRDGYIERHCFGEKRSSSWKWHPEIKVQTDELLQAIKGA